MELISVFLLLFFAWLFIKILGFIFTAGAAILTIPLKLLAILFSSLIVFLVLIPLGIIGFLASLIIFPVVILSPLIPIVILIAGFWLLFRKS